MKWNEIKLIVYWNTNIVFDRDEKTYHCVILKTNTTNNVTKVSTGITITNDIHAAVLALPCDSMDSYESMESEND